MHARAAAHRRTLAATALLALLLCAGAAGAAPDPRSLPPGATFADLIAAVKELTATGQGAARSDCLLQRSAEGSRLLANLDPAEPPTAVLPAELDVRLKAPGEVSLNTRAGRIGAEDAVLALSALVPTPRSFGQGLLPVLVVTEQGTYFTIIAPGKSFGAAGARAQLLQAADLLKLQSGVLSRAQGVVVTAAATVPVTRLIDAMAPLSGFRGPVILATVSAGGAAGPALPSVAITVRGAPVVEAADLCRGGIMDIPRGGRPGQLPMGQMVTATERIQREAQRVCGAALPADGGGELRVAMRIAASGRVTGTCIERDTTGQRALRDCVLGVVRAQAMPRPSGGTFVNFGCEVKLTPAYLSQRAVCAP